MACGVTWDTRLGDIAPKTPGGLICTACWSIFGFVVLLLIGPSSVGQLDRLHFGLLKNGVDGIVNMDDVMTPGRYYIGFWMHIIPFPSTLNTIEFSDESPETGVKHLSVLRSRDKDGKRIYMDISVQYRLSSSSIGKLYEEMLIHYEEVYISELRDALSKAGNKFAVAEAWLDYDSVTAIMKEACNQALEKLHAQCWGLQLWGIRLESRYEAALIRTQVRKQAQRTEQARKAHSVVRAATQAMLAEYRKDKTILLAKGEAAKYLVEETARANAQKALMDAQAKSVDMVKRIVVLNSTSATLSEDQLILYQRLIMLQQQTNVNFIVQANSGGVAAPDAVNARAYRQIAEVGLAAPAPPPPDTST